MKTHCFSNPTSPENIQCLVCLSNTQIVFHIQPQLAKRTTKDYNIERNNTPRITTSLSLIALLSYMMHLLVMDRQIFSRKYPSLIFLVEDGKQKPEVSLMITCSFSYYELGWAIADDYVVASLLGWFPIEYGTYAKFHVICILCARRNVCEFEKVGQETLYTYICTVTLLVLLQVSGW